MVFRFLISQHGKLLPHPEPVEHNHFLSMSKSVGADDSCGPPQVPGDIQAWQRCTDQTVHRPDNVFAIQHRYFPMLQVFIILDITRGKK